MTSEVTITPRANSTSSTSRKLRQNRKYSHTAWLMISAGKRWLILVGGWWGAHAENMSHYEENAQAARQVDNAPGLARSRSLLYVADVRWCPDRHTGQRVFRQLCVGVSVLPPRGLGVRLDFGNAG